MDQAERIARRAAMEGIPLACAGQIGHTMGSAHWNDLGGAGQRRWFYDGLAQWMCDGHNVSLIAVRPTGMDKATFGRLWRGVVKDLLRGANCVRVTVIGG